ncbi:uncharacterized protein Triagg1_9460 [Trichoderma aggressivum f. europaeum]|uniref:Uncharacterized protein n=1 Tax=Trichoderma aggressivum f. europaeum TaxID=173218 RepID=A0AAE1J236_9HYPO|nr:hypothetical protein Triagg1_9460 [Trichoderma aggressivum f. europaeum]
MGIFRPIAKLENKYEAWRFRNLKYTPLDRVPCEPEWWELVMAREKRNRKAERKAAKEARKAEKEERKAAREQRRRERLQNGEFDWRNYIPRFPKVVGYTPLWKIDEMLASGKGVRWE